VDWAGNLADKLHHDLLTALRLKKYDPLKQCPRCGSRHFTAFKEKYKSYDTTDTETKTIRHYSSDGEEVGTTEIDYEVPTTSSVKIKLLKCDRCSKKWSIADGEVAYVPPD
jgi:DNA-directed RNA polymerase subunit RPC12/RpoP